MFVGLFYACAISQLLEVLHPLLLPALLIDQQGLVGVYQLVVLLLIDAGDCLLQELLPSFVLFLLLQEDFPHPLLEVSELVAADGLVVLEACGVELKQLAKVGLDGLAQQPHLDFSLQQLLGKVGW